MKWLLVILLAFIGYSFIPTKPIILNTTLKRDTVPTGAAPQLFGSKLYEFRNYTLIDSFLMVMGGDTFAIPRWPALKYKTSDNRWYGYHGQRWRAFLNGTDTVSLSNRINAGAVTAGYGINVTATAVRVDTTVIDARYQKIFNVVLYGADPDSNGTDDCPAIKAAIAAAYAAGGGIVWFPKGHYTIGCPLVHSQDGIDPDAQIVLPLTTSGTSHYPRITFQGESQGNWTAELVTSQPKNKDGVILESTIVDTGYVFGSSYDTPPGFGGPVNWTWWGFKNIEIRVRSKTGGSEISHTMSGIDTWAPRSANFDHVKVTVQSQEADMLQPYSGTIGVRLQHYNNNGNILINNLNVSGFYTGVTATEHMNATELITFSCYNGLYLPYMVHSGYIAQYTSEGCVNHIYVSDETGPFTGGPMDLNIGTYNVEHTTTGGKWYTYNSDIVYEDTSASNRINIAFAHMAESGIGEVYTFNTNAPQRVTIGHDGREGSFLSKYRTAYYNSLFPIQWSTLTGTNRGVQLLNTTNPTDNLAELEMYPASGTNVGSLFTLVPRGTGFSSTLKTGLNFFNTNYIADATNSELFQIKAAGNDYIIGSLQFGTGSLRPVRLQMAGVNALTIQTNALPYADSFQLMNTYLRPYTSASASDAIKTVGTSLGATFGIQNLNASGFSGVEYIDQNGNVNVFTGFSNSNGQEFRFNNVASGGYIRFITGGAEKLRINNTGGLTFNTAFTFPATDGSSGQVLQTNGSGTVTWESPASATTIYNGNSTLTSDRTVSTGGFTTTWTGSNDNETSFAVTNTGTTNASAISGTASGTSSVGVSGTSTSYLGVFGSSTSGNAVQGQSSSGTGVVGVSSTGAAFRGQINPSSNNAVENILTLLRTSSSGAGANGIGSAIQFELETATSGLSQTAGRQAFIWTDATDETRTSQYEIYGVNSGTTARKAALAGSGQWTWDTYGSGTHTGTPTGTLQTTSGGAIIEGPIVAAGTYTPTLTNGTNVAASTAYSCQYMRVGNTVTVSGKVDIDPTAAAATVLGISLPIASALANDNEAGGAGSAGIESYASSIKADATNDRVQMDFVIPVAGTTANTSWYFSFTYRIL